MIDKEKIAVVIPSYKVKKQIVPLINELIDLVGVVIVVDDKCPENSGKWVESEINDKRVVVLFHEENKGVGGATITGYDYFLRETNCEIAVKIDGDGQMSPKLIYGLIEPILLKQADYSKGNRFYNLSALSQMPRVRLLGNSILSLVNKFVNGYWQVMDPTNGFTAISRRSLKKINLLKIDQRYFFESDMLFRLGINRVVVSDFAMDAFYGEEESGLNIYKVLFEFPPKYLKRFIKRIFYSYFLRDFNAGSFQLIFGLIFTLYGTLYGAVNWYSSITLNVEAKTGTIMLAALPIIIGSQLLIGFLNYDVQNAPK
ncbi:MAG: glycosyltransferase family 2 protein [Vicingaceae bacterium]